MLICRTRLASPSIASRSERSKRTRRPARSPPACSLVWPGHATTALLPNALKAVVRMPRKPEPYAISTVTATMPHTMPSIVSALRVRWRAMLDQLWATISRSTLASRLVAQRLDRVDGRRAARRVHGREQRDRAEERERHQARRQRRQLAREELRHRQQVNEPA